MIDYSTLNPPQLEGVKTTDGPVLILAGAGSGKTRVLTHRAAYLIQEKGVLPYHILAITFTNKAAKEMQQRVSDLLGDDSLGVWVSTFHSLCIRLLRTTIEPLGFTSNFTVYDADDQKTLMKEVCKRLEIDTKQIKEKFFLNAISRAKDELIWPAEYEKNATDYEEKQVARVYKAYQDALKKNNAVDFDDLIMFMVEVLRTNPAAAQHYRDRFQYIMVDEYQDTNTAQFELVRLLAGENKNLCVVGDDDQSIYKFRGANIYNILNFEKYFPEAKVIKLEENYRSTANILNAANAVIANNKGRKAKTLWTSQDDGDNIVLMQTETAYDEASYIVRDICRKARRGKKLTDFAVLYRTNAQSRILEEKFIQENVPYRIVGGVNFYSRKEIKDILAYLKTVDNGQDDVACKRILNVPKRGIGATSINKIDEYSDYYNMPFYDALKEADKVPGLGAAAKKVTPFVNLIQVARTRAAEYVPVAAQVKALLDETGYVTELKLENTDEARDRIANIDEFISKATVYDETADDPSLTGFLEEVALIADIDRLDDDSDYVTLMTLHSAKGLEFPHVYMAGMEDGLFPSMMSILSTDPLGELEEERRLCYVGITRAKETLHLTAARCRVNRGEMTYSSLSRFVKEIPEHLLEKDGSAALDSIFRTKKSERGTLEMEEMREIKPDDRNNTAGGFTRASRASTMRAMSGAQAVMQKAKDITTGGTLDYAEGDRVRHIKFGEGTVKSIVEGGKDFEVTVEFDGVGVKKMFAAFAKLQKI